MKLDRLIINIFLYFDKNVQYFLGACLFCVYDKMYFITSYVKYTENVSKKVGNEMYSQ